MEIDYNNILLQIKSYDPDCKEELIRKAIDFAIKYHGNQIRDSGEPYYYHPISVAQIIIDMKLDSDCIITGLLHDTIEDTELTLEDISKHFGAEVAKLVDGVTKLTQIEFIPDHTRQAENFRKFLLAMSEDIRVLIVKLADRLHNMRTIDAIKSAERKLRIALETMEIYAPLAERIGMQQIKVEMQDIGFKILQPEARESILNRLNLISHQEGNIVNNIINELNTVLTANSINSVVHGRQKTPYSIWLKMQNKNIDIEQISDIMAFRIILDDISMCYKALGIIHTNYQMVPGSFQDFISTPKNNGYRSIHTIIIGPLTQKIEVQIRTNEMHNIAEFGVAAHWLYKQKYYDPYSNQYRWIRELLNILEQSGSNLDDFLNNTKLAIYYDQVFCFTPKGKLIAMPKGATIIDFAYAVHSNIGNHCVSAKVNGKIVSLKYQMQNGDQVEIITSKNKNPSLAWEKFVVTGKALSEIKRFIRLKKRSEYIKLGNIIFNKILKLLKIDELNHELIANVMKFFNKESKEEFLYAVGNGNISREDLIRFIAPKNNKILSKLLKFDTTKKVIKSLKDIKYSISIEGLVDGVAVHMASCCSPLPGDMIVGIFHIGNGMTVHNKDCKMLKDIPEISKKLINLKWSDNESSIPFISRININIINDINSLSILCSKIARENANVVNIKFINRNSESLNILLDIQVKDVNHVENIISILKNERIVISIKRSKI